MVQHSEMLSSKKLSRVLKLACGILVLTIVGWVLCSVGRGQTANRSASAPGRVEAASDILSLGTSATGTIAELLVKAGDHVQPGQHLVRVECGNVERELEARKSDLAAAEAALSRIVRGPRSEEVRIGIANVNLADARLQEAEKSFQRKQQL